MSPTQQLFDSAKKGDYDRACDALSQGANSNAVVDGWTPLIWAAQEGHTAIVELLVDHRADVNFADVGGITPLRQAISGSHLDTAEYLILYGADVHHHWKADGKSTALHTAAAYGLLDAIKLLIQYGANINAMNNEGQTPHDVAVDCGEVEVAELLWLMNGET